MQDDVEITDRDGEDDSAGRPADWSDWVWY